MSRQWLACHPCMLAAASAVAHHSCLHIEIPMFHVQRLEYEFHATNVTGAETYADAVSEMQRRNRSASGRDVSLLTGEC